MLELKRINSQSYEPLVIGETKFDVIDTLSGKICVWAHDVDGQAASIENALLELAAKYENLAAEIRYAVHSHRAEISDDPFSGVPMASNFPAMGGMGDDETLAAVSDSRQDQADYELWKGGKE